MSKLFKLKKWLTLPDAAHHLSIVVEEEVTEADILRLALDGHLKLSVFLVNGARAKPCNVIQHADVEWKEILGLEGEIVYVPKKPITSFENGVILEFLDGYTYLDSDVWDLPLIGDEKYHVEHEYQMRIEGPTVEGGCLDGAFVMSTGPHQRYFQLQDSFEPKEVDTPEGKKTLKKSYFPAFGLPDDSVLVVRTGALREFEASINDEPMPPLADRAHVSDKLAKMNQAAAKFWANAARDDRGTHPDNATVAAWLVQQGFSSTLAKKAATIIRPEWAPTGRKPEE